MRGAVLAVELERAPPRYRPGETLSGRYRWEGGEEVEAVEVSVLWRTEGKGKEEFGVHHFERRAAGEQRSSPPGRAGRFSTRLPASPLSYDGLIVKVCWCVRVRVFWRGGARLAEAPFRLGEVAPAWEAFRDGNGAA
jgi:hypothetical protein